MLLGRLLLWLRVKPCQTVQRKTDSQEEQLGAGALFYGSARAAQTWASSSSVSSYVSLPSNVSAQRPHARGHDRQPRSAASPGRVPRQARWSCSTRPCCRSSPCRIRSARPLRPPKRRPTRGSKHPPFGAIPSAAAPRHFSRRRLSAARMHSTKRCGELEMAKGHGETWRWQKGTGGWIREEPSRQG